MDPFDVKIEITSGDRKIKWEWLFFFKLKHVEEHWNYTAYKTFLF